MMDIRRVCAVYFSPTGSTAKVADTIVAELAVRLSVPAEQQSFTRPRERENTYTFGEQDLVV